MEKAVSEELKLGGLMRDDVSHEIDVLHKMSASLLEYDAKRKRIEIHFDSLVDMIKRKQNEAEEAIRVKEEEAKLRVERLRDEKLEEQEKRLKDIIKVKMKDVERRVVEKEKEIEDVKMEKQRISTELCEKEKEVAEMKKVVEELTARVQENASLNDAFKRLSDENFELREEVRSLTQRLELKAQPLRREEQLSAIQNFLQILSSAGIITICDTMKHPDADLGEDSGENLLKVVKEHIGYHEVATCKVSSVLIKAKDRAQDLVLEALKISYRKELEDQGSESIYRSCRILLLEQLSHTSPQATSKVKEEARKVAVDWITKVEKCSDNFSEISRFLQFLYAYDIASKFSDEVLVPILYNAAIHKGADLCFTLGYANRIAGYTKSLLKNGQRLKALEYICAFKLENRFSVGKIVHEEMNHIKQTCQSKLKEGGHSQAAEILKFEIDSVKELIKGIKYLKFQGKYNAVNLEQRLVKLENKKQIKKRSADDPCPNIDLESSRKKRCHLQGTPEPNETGPKDTTNVHSDIGHQDSDPELSTMKRHTLTGTAKSIEDSPEDTFNVYPQSGSRILCFSNPPCDPATSREECQLPGTAQSIETAFKDTLGILPESGSVALCCPTQSSDPEPSQKKECQLPGGSTPIEPSSNDTSNVQTESAANALSCFNPSSSPKEPKPRRKKKSKLPGTGKSTKVASKEASNAIPASGSISLHHRNPRNPKSLNKHECLSSGTVKPAGFQKQASIAFPEFGSRNALHSPDMQGAPFHFHPMQFHYGVVSPYIFPSQQPSWYEPQELPPPSQYYHSYPPFETHPQVPTWQYQLSDEQPYFDRWP